MSEKGVFTSEEFSKPARRLLRRAVIAGVDPLAVQEIAKEALLSTTDRRSAITDEQRGGGQDVVNRKDLLTLRDLTNKTIKDRSTLELTLPAHSDIVWLGHGDPGY